MITCTVLYCLHRNDDKPGHSETSRGDHNAFLLNIAMSLVGLMAAVAFRKRFVENSEAKSSVKSVQVEVEETKTTLSTID